MTDSTPRLVKCPQCKKMAAYSAANPTRPFCSERCRLIDLGEWASEGYRIPVQPNSSSDSLSSDEDDFDDSSMNEDH